MRQPLEANILRGCTEKGRLQVSYSTSGSSPAFCDVKCELFVLFLRGQFVPRASPRLARTKKAPILSCSWARLLIKSKQVRLSSVLDAGRGLGGQYFQRMEGFVFFFLFTGRKIPLTALGFNFGNGFLLPKCWPKGEEGGRREETHPHNFSAIESGLKKKKKASSQYLECEIKAEWSEFQNTG